MTRFLPSMGVIVWCACSQPSGSNPTGSGRTECKSIGTTGGAVELEKVKLTIPAGALGMDVSICITSAQMPAAANYTAHTPVYVFKPENTDFNVPISVEYDLSGREPRRPVVFWTRKGTAVFERQMSSVNGSKISAQVSHFSMGFVAETSNTSSGDGGTTTQAFEIVDLDPTAREETYIAMAVDKSSGKVGVVYFTPRGTMTMMGTPDYDIKYVEYENGRASTPETIRYVQRRIGVAVAFDPSGQPVVSYLGGDQGFIPGNSIFWFQSDSVIARRTAPGMWTETVITRNGADVMCGNRVSDTGFLVGLFPALAFDSSGKLYLAYRDCHNGQFPQQDWAGSDVEVIEDVLGGRQLVCARPGGDDKGGWGGRIKMTIGANDQPALVFDKALGGADTIGNDLYFQIRQPNGIWSAVSLVANISNTMTGGTLAYHPTEGWAIAITDATNNKLLYRRNPDPLGSGTKWLMAEEVFASGTGGWYPSLALDTDPNFGGEPSIAFYVCSRRDQVQAGACPQDQDELRISRKSGGVWQEVTVDTGGGYSPQLAFLPNGKRVIAYRVPAAITPGNRVEPTAGAVKLAIER